MAIQMTNLRLNIIIAMRPLVWGDYRTYSCNKTLKNAQLRNLKSMNLDEFRQSNHFSKNRRKIALLQFFLFYFRHRNAEIVAPFSEILFVFGNCN